MIAEPLTTAFSYLRFTRTFARTFIRTRSFIAALAFSIIVVTDFVYSHEGEMPVDGSIDSSYEAIVVATRDDTFSSIALREFGTVGLARLLAEYNSMPIQTVFSGDEELVHPFRIAPDENFASVSYSKGQVTYRPAGGNTWARQLTNIDHVHTSDVLDTGADGFVSLLMSSGSVVNIQPNSLVRVEDIQCLSDDQQCTVVLDALAGEVKSDVNHKPGQPARFLIKTPYASAAVRGTSFNFSANESRTNVGVTEGEVVVATLSSQFDLPEGYGVSVEATGAASIPKPLLPAPLLNNLPTRLTDEDTISWQTLDDAQSYTIAYSLDAAGSQTALRNTTDDAQQQPGQLDPGPYYLSVAGYDEAGLRGMAGQAEITFVSRDENLPVPVVKMEREQAVGGEAYLSVTDAYQTNSHEIQIATTETFFDAISVDAPANGGVTYLPQSDLTYYARARVITTTVAGNETAGSYGPSFSFQF